MKFVKLSGATLLELASEDEIPQLLAAGVAEDSETRINQQGDIELLQDGSWEVIGGLLGNYQSRIKNLTGLDWS